LDLFFTKGRRVVGAIAEPKFQVFEEFMAFELQTSSNTFVDTQIRRRVNINGIEFDEAFIANLIAKHLQNASSTPKPTISTAFEIYMRESSSAHKRKFRENSNLYFRYFFELFGDIPLDELKHHHITQYRDYQFQRGLRPGSIRKHNNMLNAMLNMAFKHLDIDRLSPFRALRIKGEGEFVRPIPTITPSMLDSVKRRLLESDAAYRLIALIQLNTGMRISEPCLARLDDLVLDHDIPHLWVRKNSLTDRKTKSSIRAVPLVGASLEAAIKLHKQATAQKSEWLAPGYARDNGNTSCSAIINKTLRDLNFRSHMFRHAFIDRMKACNDIPTRVAESITGHSRGGSEFDSYGTVGYTLEQKLAVIKRVAI
jgi:integrase